MAERKPLVVPDDEMARRLATEIGFFWGGSLDPAAQLDPIAALPGIDISPYADLSPDRDSIVERVATLYRLSKPELRPRLVATSAEALVRKTMPPAELAARGRTIRVGDTVDRDELAKFLTAAAENARCHAGRPMKKQRTDKVSIASFRWGQIVESRVSRTAMRGCSRVASTSWCGECQRDGGRCVKGG